MLIQNRYEFLYFIECLNGNPNGDPDMGNTPRIDPQDMHGLISDVAIKRRIRNYIQSAYAGNEKMKIIVQNATNMNKYIAQANESCESKAAMGSREKVDSARTWVCKNYFDVRTFGAVLSTGANAGQIRGPVQLTFARSIEAILPMDISITRMAVAEEPANVNTFTQYEEWENKQDADKLRTMGRKQLIPYGMYEGRGFISAGLAEDTGFDDFDLKALWEAILNMYEHDRSSSKGHMSTILPVIVFRHSGTDSDPVQRIRQAKLGCAPAQKLFDLISLHKNDGVAYPRSYKDYKMTVNMSGLPKGIDIGFLYEPYSDIIWNKLPEGLEWVVTK